MVFVLLSSYVFAGFSQGVRRSVGGLATILGPLWAGGLTENMYIMMGVMMALLALLTVCKRKIASRERVCLKSSCLWRDGNEMGFGWFVVVSLCKHVRAKTDDFSSSEGVIVVAQI